MLDNIKDIDMCNCHPEILSYLCKKYNINCDILNEYINNRENLLNQISHNRKKAKTLFLEIMNGGFKNEYSTDCNNVNKINEFLKNFEKEIKNIQNQMYEIDNRFNDKTIYNHKGKSLSRIILEEENKILQIMINFFKKKNIKIFTLEFDGLKIIDENNLNFKINEIEELILKKTNIPMKLEFKEIID